ncbi:MAG: DoxX family protein [Bacteroidetes bacterium]|nr:DoxX family protein [Bacteroidota bacterium]
MKRLRILLIWAIGISFIAIGFLKYFNLDAFSKEVFEQADFPKWLRFGVGTLEMIGGVLLVMTAGRSQRIGTILIGFIMLGAIGTRVMLKDSITHLIVPSVILVLSILISLDFEIKKKNE